MRMGRNILLGSLLALVLIACFMIVISDESDASLKLDPNDATASPRVYNNTNNSGTVTLPSDPYFRLSGTNYTYTFTNGSRTFLGWAYDEDATTPDYTGGEVYTVTGATDVLYAVWEWVTFDPNGGTITRGNNGSVTEVYGILDDFTNAPGNQFNVDSYSYSYSNWAGGWSTTTNSTRYTFARTGYTFLGWADSPSATVPDYESGDSFGPRSGSFTVYAVWRSNYNITFNANGGSVYDGSATTSSISITADILKTAPGPCFTVEGTSYSFYRNGYILKGWSATSSSTNPEYTYGTTIPTDRNATLYAIWTSGITFDPNGGTVRCSDGSASPYTVTPGSITIPGNEIETANLTYKYIGPNGVLKGWATSSSATEPDYVEGDVVTINNGCSLYAVWGSAVVFDPNGGIVKIGNKEVDPYTASLDAPVYVPSNTFTLVDVNYTYTYTGHTFLGWATRSDATEAEYSEGNILPTASVGYRLYAVWAKNDYDLTLHYSDDYEIIVKVNYKERVDLTSYMGYDTGMTGYRIVGWCKSPMNLSVKEDGAYLMPNGKRYNQYYTLETMTDDTIYPIWAKICTASTGGSLTISGSGCYYITCPIDANNGGYTSINGYYITVSSGESPYIFTDHLDITASSAHAAMTINSSCNVELIVMSDSSFTGASISYTETTTNTTRVGYAGINVKSGGKLTVSSFSTGVLNARGGDAFGTYNNRTQVNGYSGAGIGSNGNEGSCGTIIIDGGTVYARGGSAIVNMYANYRYRGSSTGEYNSSGLYSGAGIGGTGATIKINGGTVTAATGSIYGMFKDGLDDTKTYTNGSGGSLWGTASEPLNPTKDQGTTIRDEATVYLFGRSGGTVIVEDPVTVKIYAREDGTIKPVGSAASINIEGVTINLGDSQITTQGLTIQIDAEIVKEGNNFKSPISATLITGLMNYFSGQGTYSNGSYTIYVDKDNDLPHGVLNIYGKNGAASPTVVTGTEVFGNIYPSAATTLGSTDPTATHELKTLTLDLAEGYVFVNVLFWDGDSWEVYTPGAGESISQSNNKVTAKLNLSINSTGTEHRICFAAMRETVDVNISCNYSEGAHTFTNAMVTTSDVDPYPISWTTYSTGVHAIYYKSNVTYTISLLDGSTHLNLQVVTVDGVTVEPVDNGDGTYTLTLSDISDDMNISVSFKPTVKVTTIIVMDTNYDGTYISKATAVITGSGSYQFTERTVEIATQTGSTVYKEHGYLDRNGVAKFTMADYVTTYNASDPTIISGVTLGIKKIDVQVGASHSIIANGIPDIYTTDNLSDETTITITLTSVEHEVVFISETTTYTRRYKAGTYITLPDKDILSEMTSDSGGAMYVARGYDLLHWVYNGMNIDAGSTVQVNERHVFTAEWSTTAHDYRINYTLDGGSFPSSADYTYTVNTARFMIEQPERAGYDFAGWTGTDLVSANKEVWVDPSDPNTTIADRYYTATWTPNDYTVTYDPNGMSVIVREPRNYTFGDRYEDDKYGQLPIFPNQIGQDGKMYSFGGWALDKYGIDRITTDTRVSTADNHSIYIIWILSGESLYAINLIGTEGGSPMLSSISGEEGDEITLTIRPDLGYRPTDVLINIGTEYKSVSELHTLYPDNFSEFSLPGGWEEGDNVTYTFKIKANTTHMYYVKVEFEPIEYTIRITHIQEGVPHTTVFGTYTIKSDPVYITSSTVGTYANHTFAGWTGTDIADIETSYIMIPTGSRGDRAYEEVWYATSYSISYTLNEATANSPYNHPTYRTGDTVILYEPIYPSQYDFVGWCTDAELTNIITQISSSSTGDIELFAKLVIVTPIAKPTSIGTVIYDGTEVIGVVQGTGYSLSGDWKATYAGTYTVTVMLDSSHVWAGETGEAKRANLELTWTISKRDVYVMSGSNWKIYDGTPLTIPSNEYYTMGIAPGDINRMTITTPAQSITDVGRCVNYIVISSNVQGQEGIQMMQSYNFHVYPGVYIIFEEESTTVTLEYEGTATERTSASMMQITGAINNAQAGNVVTVLPRTRRQML